MIEYIVENINNYTIDALKNHVSEARLIKSTKYRHETDTLRSLCVEFILNKLIQTNCPEIKTPVQLFYDDDGKPWIPETYNAYQETKKTDISSLLKNSADSDYCIHISLSHSGDYVAAMISDVPCGIDIEKTSRNIEKIAQKFFLSDELNNISNKDEYIKIWTLKEAVMKATGKGLSLGMNTFSVADCLNKTGTVEINNISYTSTNLEAPAGYALAISYSQIQ